MGRFEYMVKKKVNHNFFITLDFMEFGNQVT